MSNYKMSWYLWVAMKVNIYIFGLLKISRTALTPIGVCAESPPPPPESSNDDTKIRKIERYSKIADKLNILLRSRPSTPSSTPTQEKTFAMNKQIKRLLLNTSFLVDKIKLLYQTLVTGLSNCDTNLRAPLLWSEESTFCFRPIIYVLKLTSASSDGGVWLRNTYFPRQCLHLKMDFAYPSFSWVKTAIIRD